MKILHLDSSILGDASASRVLSAALVEELRSRYPDATVTARDLVAAPIAHLDGPIAGGFRQPGTVTNDAGLRAEHTLSDTLVSELLASDVIVLGAPMYNFSVPSQLKAWLDRIAQPGRTFRYTETGPVGLAGDKAVLVASTRGGMYSSGPAGSMDHQESYLSAFFGFIGIKRVSFVRAELLTKGAELRSTSMRQALDAVPAAVTGLLTREGGLIMIHVVTLTYLRPVEDINQHLDAHKGWLIANVRQGKVILAGPMENRTGGLLLASCSDREELDAMMALDPFIESGVASYEVYACVPALASLQLPPHWAPLAKFV